MSRMRAVEWGRNLLLMLVVVAPIALSAQNIIGWARDPEGLGLRGQWPYLVFFALDAAAGVCVLMTLILAATGERAGAFGPLVWVFALASAFAGYRHGTQPAAPRDTWWFFPLMSVLGPMLLHLVLGYVRRNAQTADRRRLTYAPASAYRLGRWVPGVGAFAETYCAWRVGRLEGIATPADAIDRYRHLCPDGEWRVLRAMRTEAAARRATALADIGTDTTGTPGGHATATTPDTDPDMTGTPGRTSPGQTADILPDIPADTDHAGGLPKPRVRRPLSTGDQVTAMRRRNPAITVAEMAKRLDKNPRTIRRYLPPPEGTAPVSAVPVLAHANGSPVMS